MVLSKFDIYSVTSIQLIDPWVYEWVHVGNQYALIGVWMDAHVSHAAMGVWMDA